MWAKIKRSYSRRDKSNRARTKRHNTASPRRHRLTLHLEPLEQRHLLAVTAVDDPNGGGTYQVTEDRPFTLGAVETLISRNSEWNYLDEITNGLNLPQTPAEDYPLDAEGDRWFEPSFDIETSDAAIGLWKSGPGILGVGTIIAGPNQTALGGLDDGVGGQNSVTTYLFRREFTITQETLDENPEYRLSLLADDGGVLYINGVEVFRSDNIDPGPVETTTLTSAPGNEGDYLFTRFQPSLAALLTVGVNTIAYELHQTSLTSSDAGFDLSLVASLPSGTFADLAANDDFANAVGGAGVIGPDDPQLFSTQNGTVYINLETDQSGQDFGFTYIPDQDYTGPDLFEYAIVDDESSSIAVVSLFVNPVNDPPVAVDNTYTTGRGQTISPTFFDSDAIALVFAGSEWFYSDSGTDQDLINPTWREIGFDPAGAADWNATPGAAELGFGEEGNQTVINNAAAATGLTYYFQRTFGSVVPYNELVLQLKRDDGAAVYINGIEVARDNLPPGAAFNDPAASTASDDGDLFHPFTLDLAQLGIELMPSGNTIAVEVHQIDAASSDVSFDLSLSTPPSELGVGILGNDSDVDDLLGDLTVELLDDSQFDPLTVGTLVVNPNGTFVFTPVSNTLAGTFSFTYRVLDDNSPQPAASTPATVSLVLIDINRGPVLALADLGIAQFVTAEDTRLLIDAESGPSGPLGVGVLANDQHPLELGTPLTLILASGPQSGGSVEFNSDNRGGFAYTPGANFNGTDSFTYQVDDGFTLSNPATVEIQVLSVDDPAIATDEAFFTDDGELLQGTPGQTSDVLIDRNSVWRYLDDGSSQDGLLVGGEPQFDNSDASWFASTSYETDFENSPWKSGPAELGHTEGDETTVLQPGRITYYFRQSFDVADPQNTDRLLLQARIDDAAAFYINGVEVDRLRLAANATSMTPATESDPSDGTFYSLTVLDLDQMGVTLLPQDNLLAVELHNSRAGSDISFDVGLVALSSGPATAQGSLLENDFDVDGDPFEIISVEGQSLGGEPITVNTRTATVTVSPDGSFTYRAVDDYFGADSFQYSILGGASARATVVVISSPDAPEATDDLYTVNQNAVLTIDVATPADLDFVAGQTLPLIPLGADQWRYLDNGSDPGTAWRQLSFDPNNPAGNGTLPAWRSGQAELGYGDGDEATEVLFGANPDNSQNNAANVFPTTYFRKTFSTPDNLDDLSNLFLRLKRDDGAVVYLNGVQILLSNLGPDPTFDQFAHSRAIGDGDPPLIVEIDPALLLPPGGAENVLAVEIHQAAPNSSDISFDAELFFAKVPLGVLANDIDADGDPLSAQLGLLDEPQFAQSFTFNSDGTFVYNPLDTFTGTDSFSYTASDGTGTVGTGNSATATVFITVTGPAAIVGDFNNDGQINLLDLARLRRSFGITMGATVADGDLDSDQDVDRLDLQQFGLLLFAANPPAPAPGTAPQASSRVVYIGSSPLVAAATIRASEQRSVRAVRRPVSIRARPSQEHTIAALNSLDIAEALRTRTLGRRSHTRLPTDVAMMEQVGPVPTGQERVDRKDTHP